MTDMHDNNNAGATGMIQQPYNLRDYLDSIDAGKVLAEIHRLTAEMGAADFAVVEKIYDDISSLFEGRYAGFRASNTKYHNLEHTNAVALAVARLMHGLWLEGHPFTAGDLVLGIVAALFHDTGLIQAEYDTEGTGAKYTIGHEKRSIDLARNYLPSHGFDAEAVEDCSYMILYTILFKPVQDIPFRREAVSLLGRILGSADLLAQMADRSYLEKIPLLFFEFKEGGVPNYSNELDMLVATENFYEFIFKKRLFGDLGNIAAVLRSHFRVRWNIDNDLYMESVEKNIAYLRLLNESCGGDYHCYLKKLRRGNILRNLYGQIAV